MIKIQRGEALSGVIQSHQVCVVWEDMEVIIRMMWQMITSSVVVNNVTNRW